jgi:hypothetical protein
MNCNSKHLQLAALIIEDMVGCSALTRRYVGFSLEAFTSPRRLAVFIGVVS